MSKRIAFWVIVLSLFTAGGIQAQTDEIALEGQILLVEVTSIDSTQLSFLTLEKQNLTLPLRRIDFVIIQDGDKYRRLQEAVPMFAPYLRFKDLKNGITDADELAKHPIQGVLSFRLLYESRKAVNELLLPYKGRDLVYLASIQQQKASRSLWVGLTCNVIGTVFGALTEGRVAQLGFAVAGLGFVGGLGGAAYYTNRSAFYQVKASERAW